MGFVFFCIVLCIIFYGIIHVFAVAGTEILIISVSILGLFLVWHVYVNFYFQSRKFISIKKSIEQHTAKCNELNAHIEQLKKSFVNIKQVDYGQADYIDNSVYSYSRPELSNFRKSDNVYDCSLSVCKNAQAQPFKYICKYFNIKATESSLSEFENILNDFAAAEHGVILLKKERDVILGRISNQIPFLIRNFCEKRMIKELGFDEIDFSKLHFPKYTFRYVSAGGNSSLTSETIFSVSMLDRFVTYLSELVKFRNSVAGQRALMTSKLRIEIMDRDHCTCQKCGLSVRDEPNLLLEIDHIIPLSKDGTTTRSNLQTLCWRCNRTKGAKIE